MGTLEYNSLLSSPLVAYSELDNVDEGTENDRLVELLRLLDQFETTLWLESDNCFGHETAFLIRPDQIWSNTIGGIRSSADGITRQSIELSADKFREVVRFFRGALHPNLAEIAQFHTKLNSNRFTRTMNHVGRAQKTSLLSEKITFYCSALEALLSTSQAELAHQISERVALISATTVDERMLIYRSVKECYSFRSKYIHGSVLKGETDKIQIMSKNLDEIVRKCIDAAFSKKRLAAAINDENTLDNYMIRKIFEGPSAVDDD